VVSNGTAKASAREWLPNGGQRAVDRRLEAKGLACARPSDQVDVHPAVFDTGVEEDVAAGDIAETLIKADGVKLGGESDAGKGALAGKVVESEHYAPAEAFSPLFRQNGDASDMGMPACREIDEKATGGYRRAGEAAENVDRARDEGGVGVVRVDLLFFRD
jgi:hypothetical protein